MSKQAAAISELVSAMKETPTPGASTPIAPPVVTTSTTTVPVVAATTPSSPSFFQRMGSWFSSAKEKAQTQMTTLADKAKSTGMPTLDRNTTVGKVIYVVLILAVITGVLALLQYIWQKSQPSRIVALYPEGKVAKQADKVDVTITPNTDFSYSVWIYLNSLEYKYNEWKHVMTKGALTNETQSEDQCPSLWIHPKRNSIRLCIRTDKKLDSFDIDDLPLHHWFNIGMIVRGNELEIYLDGGLTQTLALSGTAKINSGSLLFNQNGGFDGVVANCKYDPMALSSGDMAQRYASGPDTVKFWKRMYTYLYRFLTFKDIFAPIDTEADKKTKESAEVAASATPASAADTPLQCPPPAKDSK